MSIGSHSNTALVCVAFLKLKTGVDGDFEAKASRIVDWRARNRLCTASSWTGFCDTERSMTDPVVTVRGRRMDGNSIW